MLLFVLIASLLQTAHTFYAPNRRQISRVDSLIRQWAPLIWLAPGERFFPGGVEKFLENVVPTSPKEIEKIKLKEKLTVKNNISRIARENTHFCKNNCIPNLDKMNSLEEETISLPSGGQSKNWFLTAKEDIGTLLKNSSSFIHGYNPLYYSVPVYAIVSHCPPYKTTHHPLIKNVRATNKKQKEDILKDDINQKLRNFHHRDENNYASITNGRVKPQNKYINHFKGQTDNEFEVGNISELFKNWQGRQEAPSESSKRFQGPSFTVTYWLFFPFSEGKDVCVVETGPRLLGPWPLPLLGGHCLGKRRRYGSHLGDWEHLSIQFVNGQPQSLYTSTHKLGAYYKFYKQQRNSIFRLYRHELREGGRVEGWLQNPKFPPTVYLTKPLHATPAPRIPNLTKLSGDGETMRPTLFAAKGSHGLWASPGHHQYVRYPPLEDITGYGTPWATWTNLQILHKTKEKQPICFNKRDVDSAVEISSKEESLTEKYNHIKTTPLLEEMSSNESSNSEGGCSNGSEWPSWMSYQGHWGESRKGCHEALSKLGVGGWSCEFSDGPKGIPAKKSHFSCNYI